MPLLIGAFRHHVQVASLTAPPIEFCRSLLAASAYHLHSPGAASAGVHFFVLVTITWGVQPHPTLNSPTIVPSAERPSSRTARLLIAPDLAVPTTSLLRWNRIAVGDLRAHHARRFSFADSRQPRQVVPCSTLRQKSPHDGPLVLLSVRLRLSIAHKSGRRDLWWQSAPATPRSSLRQDERVSCGFTKWAAGPSQGSSASTTQATSRPACSSEETETETRRVRGADHQWRSEEVGPGLH